MPNVSSTTDSNFNYYKQRLNDLEDQVDEDRKRADEKRREEIARLEARQKEALERKEQEAQEAMDRVRVSSAEALERERDFAKRDREDLLKQTYNKIGRYGGLDPFTLKDQVNQLRKEEDLRRTAEARNQKLTEDTYQSRSEEAQRRARDETEKAVENAKESAKASYSDMYAQQNRDYGKLRDEAQERYDDMNREVQSERERNRKAIAEVVDEYERRAKKAEVQQNDSDAKLREAYQKKLEETVRIANETAADAERKSQDTVKALQDHEHRYVKEEGQATSDVIARYDKENRDRLMSQQSLHERELQSLRDAHERTLKHNVDAHADTLRERDAYIANVTRHMAEDAHREKQEMNDTFERSQKEMLNQFAHEKQASEVSKENLLHVQAEQNHEALLAQAKAFQDAMTRKQLDYDSELNRLQTEVEYRKTSPDPLTVSPAAESKIRQAIVQDYDKTARAEQERNQRAIAHLHDEQQKRYDDLAYEKRNNEAKLAQDATLQRHLERNALLAQIEDAEFQKQDALRKKDYESLRESDNLNKNYASALERQRQGYEEIVNLQRNDASFKTSALQQERDFESKKLHREFAAREGEIVRKYEQQMYEQKADLEARLEETKLQGQVAVRDSEHRAKQMLEDQARTYEQKIAQMEEQQKEHERYLKDNFNEQLEKVRRSYALNNSKKS